MRIEVNVQTGEIKYIEEDAPAAVEPAPEPAPAPATLPDTIDGSAA
jgi:hypothetical protein